MSRRQQFARSIQDFCSVTCLVLWFCFIGCNTVRPRPVIDTTASWDSGKQDSGFIGWNQDGSGLITDHARDRFNQLVDIYGRKFQVALVHDYGITPARDGLWRITQESLVDFATMVTWWKDDQR